jgi:hypothetical protein
MRFAGIKNMLRIYLQLQLDFFSWRNHDIIMALGGGDVDESTNFF